jgi:outer membrane protein OmpA-like peptidoglycan-associated protein
MRPERRTSGKSQIRLEIKRSTELWLYSFADMYMIISVLFIATTALYARKVKDISKVVEKPKYEIKLAAPTAGRGPATAALAIAIEFDPGSTELSSEAIEQLDAVMPLLSGIKSGVVDVEGYADSKGLPKDSEYTTNLELSSARAVKVADWFLKKGVSESRVRTTGFGRAHKFVTGEKGAMSDRRVVVKFYSVEAR